MPSGRIGELGAAVLAGFTLSLWSLSGMTQAPVVEHVSCLEGEVVPEIRAAVAELDDEPSDIEKRLALVSVLEANACYQDAVRILETGAELDEQNRVIQRRLRDARSLLDEHRYFAGLELAEKEARVKRNLLRCRQLEDINACGEAVQLRPEDPSIRIAAGDAHLAAQDLSQALEFYRVALQLDAGNDVAVGKIAKAETVLRELTGMCLNDETGSALGACDKALIHGTPEEFSIQKRRGMLFQASARPEQALDAYIAAMVLQDGDESVASAIVSISEQTNRGDALTLQMRGRALLALGRPKDAVTALEAASAMDPDSRAHARYLAEAELRAARTQQAPQDSHVASRPVRVAENDTSEASIVVTRRYSNEPLGPARSY